MSQIPFEYVQQIAAALGAGWTAHVCDANECNYELRNPALLGTEGYLFCWGAMGPKAEWVGRVGGYRDTPRITIADPRIGFNPATAPKLVAGHILRRLVPPYREALARLARERADNAARASTVAHVVASLEVAGFTYRPDASNPTVAALHLYGTQGETCMDLEVSANQVNVGRGWMPHDLAITVAETIAAYYADKRKASAAE